MVERIRIFFEHNEFDFHSLLGKGAVVVDVRSFSEYSLGHLHGSVNIPLEELVSHLPLLPAGKTVITCSNSGMKSASAARLLKSLGVDTVNGGSWKSLAKELSELA